MTRADGSAHDPEATAAAARDGGGTRRVVHADGSVSQLREESRDLTGDKARARTEVLRREEAIPEVLRTDRDLVRGYLADVEAEIDAALADPEGFAALEAEAAADEATFDATLADYVPDETTTPPTLIEHEGCGELTWSDGNFCICCGEALNGSNDDESEGDGGVGGDLLVEPTPPIGGDPGGSTAAAPSGSAGPDDYPPDDEDPNAALAEAIAAIPAERIPVLANVGANIGRGL